MRMNARFNGVSRFGLGGLVLLVAVCVPGCPPAPNDTGSGDSGSDNSSNGNGSDASSKFLLGRGVDTSLDPASVGVTIEDEIQQLIGEQTLVPVAAISPDGGPAGAFAGFALADGNSFYYCGDVDEVNRTVDLQAVVLEDARGNLIMMQENRGDEATKITLATGDALDIDVSGDDPRIVFYLNATAPPTELVMHVIDAELVVDTEASSFGELNPDYNKPIRLPRQTSAKLSKVRQEEILCFLARGMNISFGGACQLWQFVSDAAPNAAVNTLCIVSNQAIDDFRGSAPLVSIFPELTEDPNYIKALATLKIGINGLCTLGKSGLRLARLLKKVAPPDLFCLGLTVVDEGTRLLDADGDSIADNICDAVLPEKEDVFIIPEQEGCDNSCVTSFDRTCDDGGPLSEFSGCELGTDCQDCGVRSFEPPPGPEQCGEGDGCNIDCPRFAPDPDCSSAVLCAEKGTCCFDDGICDITSCTDQPDIECDNGHYCERRGICCEGDFVCEGGESDLECPTIDDDCTKCGLDGNCVTGCLGGESDPDCDLCDGGNECIRGCETEDPDCTREEPDFDDCGGCGLGELCFGESLDSCFPGGLLCDDDDWCEPEQYCVDGFCEPIAKCEFFDCECTEDDDRCDNGVGACVDDGDCDLCDAGNSCIANCPVRDPDCRFTPFCLNPPCPCEVDEDCQDGYLCILDVCEEGVDVGEGCEITPCEDGQVCCQSECIPWGEPTQGICPATFDMDFGVFSPAIREVSLVDFELSDTGFSASCSYSRTDGTPGTFGLTLFFEPIGFNPPAAGMCGVEDDDGDGIIRDNGWHSNTRTLTAVSVISGSVRIIDPEIVFGQMLNNAISAGVGSECCPQ